MIYHLDWVSGAAALIGVHLTGKKKWQGQAISSGNSILLATMNAALHMYGLVPVCLLIAGMSARNARQWYKGKA